MNEQQHSGQLRTRAAGIGRVFAKLKQELAGPHPARARALRAAGLVVAGLLTAMGVAVVAGERAVAAPGDPPPAAARKKAVGKVVPLRSVASFAKIKDPAERSQALFREAGKVIMHARCVNCHPAGDTPLQGESGALHLPLVVRGSDGHGATALRCQTCHQAENFEPAKVPGDPNWHLAPIEMAWQGRSLGQICEQIKDPKRNGGKTLAQIHEHMAHDHLVGWGWNPGGDRTPVPGTQAELGALIGAWVEAGATCPSP